MHRCLGGCALSLSKPSALQANRFVDGAGIGIRQKKGPHEAARV